MSTVATIALAPKVIPSSRPIEPVAPPSAAKSATYAARLAQPQATPRQAVPNLRPKLEAGTQSAKARQVALTAQSQERMRLKDQQRELNPRPHPKVSHLSLLPRTGSNASSLRDRESSASASDNRTPKLSQTSQPPTHHDHYALPLQDRNVSRPTQRPVTTAKISPNTSQRAVRRFTIRLGMIETRSRARARLRRRRTTTIGNR
jgi:hypothetical protein